MTPILAFVVQSLVQHVHYFVKVIRTAINQHLQTGTTKTLTRYMSFEQFRSCRCPLDPNGRCLLLQSQVSTDWITAIILYCLPLRTLTCTAEYPFVTFFTPRITFDMVMFGAPVLWQRHKDSLGMESKQKFVQDRRA